MNWKKFLLVAALALTVAACQREVRPEAKKPEGPPYNLVFKSLDPAPDWVEKANLTEDDDPVVVGKASSIEGLLAAQHLAMNDAVIKIVHASLGEAVRVEPQIQWRMVPEGMAVDCNAAVWLDGKPVLIRDLEVKGAYYEIWESDGQRVTVAWMRMVWPKASLKRLLSEHSI
ncbi:MAG: hypothetical protein C4523_15570 [Myxococcales bacterium]|nr:MAG: hypothetical protein C4523_15570 [Myxococcales bacterium]